MKSLLYALIITPLVLVSMEPMLIDKAKKEKADEREFNIFSRKYCENIATIKQSGAAIAAYEEGELIPYNYDSPVEHLFESATWCTTNMSCYDPVPLLEHQFWVSKHTLNLLRFDNDLTGDLNQFGNPLSNGKNLFCYDGPNNDVSPEQEGRQNGVVLVGHTYTSARGIPQTVFHLFKQHGISVGDYKGIQSKIKTHGGLHEAFEYDQFPFTSEALIGHTLTSSAIAGGRHVAIATVDEGKRHHLHIFDYTYEENKTDKEKPDQLFQAQIVAAAHDIPRFKRLAWMYGKTLLGISEKNELYVIAVKEAASGSRLGMVTCIKQKLQNKFKDIALGRPHNHHEMVLVDEKDQLYYTDLKNRVNAAFLLKKIAEKTDDKNTCAKVARSADAEKTSEPWIDKVWIYGDKIGIRKAYKVYRLDFALMRWPVEKNMQFLSLVQAKWNAETVNKNLCELYAKSMAKKEKPIPTAKNKKRNRKK